MDQLWGCPCLVKEFSGTSKTNLDVRMNDARMKHEDRTTSVVVAPTRLPPLQLHRHHSNSTAAAPTRPPPLQLDRHRSNSTATASTRPPPLQLDRRHATSNAATPP